MKNWGIRILVLYLGFVAGILFLVYKAASQEFHLVTDNYYSQESTYPQRVANHENSKKLAQPVQIAYNAGSEQIVIQFPDELQIQGEVYLYRPSDARLDQHFVLAPEAGTQRINAKGLLKGRWQVKVDWQANGQSYYDDADLYLP